MRFTRLSLRVQHLRFAQDSFVVHQRRAEHRLVLQLLGSHLDAGLVTEASYTYLEDQKESMGRHLLNLVKSKSCVFQTSAFFFFLKSEYE